VPVESRACEADCEPARSLIAAVLAEGEKAYGKLDPDELPSATPAEMTPPDGVFLVAYEQDRPLACGGLKRLDAETVEVKRMYVVPEARSRGLGRSLLAALEEEARRLGYRRAAEAELDLALGRVVEDLPRVRQRARQAIELGHDERVARATGGERLTQAGTVPVRPGQAAVDVGTVGCHPERGHRFSLHGEVLCVGRDVGVANQQGGHELLLGDEAPRGRRYGAIAEWSLPGSTIGPDAEQGRCFQAASSEHPRWAGRALAASQACCFDP
jgi:GNAT superfamily N-acetyltransferase